MAKMNRYIYIHLYSFPNINIACIINLTVLFDWLIIEIAYLIAAGFGELFYPLPQNMLIYDNVIFPELKWKSLVLSFIG